MPLVTPNQQGRGRKGTRRRRAVGAIVVAAALLASACTSSSDTNASLRTTDQETTTTLSTNDDNRDERTAASQQTNGDSSADTNIGVVDEIDLDSAYWSGSAASSSSDARSSDDQLAAGTQTSPTTPAASSPGSSESSTSASSSGSTGSNSDRSPTPIAQDYLDQTLPLPAQSFVATVIGNGVSSLDSPAPGPAKHWFPSPTQFGNERVFMVLDDTSSPDYIKISLPVRPNGQEGWIPRDSVTISQVQHYAIVDLSTDALTVWDGGEVIVQTKAVTGKSSTPTPLGQFFVRDIIKRDNPGGAYGPYIIALSGFSDVLESFGGGLPAVAIHGTNQPWLIGGEHSSGCIRIPNDLVQQLAGSVPPGTPVTIVA